MTAATVDDGVELLRKCGAVEEATHADGEAVQWRAFANALERTT